MAAEENFGFTGALANVAYRPAAHSILTHRIVTALVAEFELTILVLEASSTKTQ